MHRSLDCTGCNGRILGLFDRWIDFDWKHLDWIRCSHPTARSRKRRWTRHVGLSLSSQLWRRAVSWGKWIALQCYHGRNEEQTWSVISCSSRKVSEGFCLVFTVHSGWLVHCEFGSQFDSNRFVRRTNSRSPRMGDWSTPRSRESLLVLFSYYDKQ